MINKHIKNNVKNLKKLHCFLLNELIYNEEEWYLEWIRIVLDIVNKEIYNLYNKK